MAKILWSAVKEEIHQGYNLRKSLFPKISKHFENRYVVSFYTRFDSRIGNNDYDAEMLNTLLGGSNKAKKAKLLLMINSPGGDPLAAEKIIKVLSEFSGNDYWVIVPGVAKSAATMICLGASRIILSPISELGPIDLQVDRGGSSLASTYSIITAYDKLMEKGINLGQDRRIEPILQQLQEFRASEIEYFRRVNNLSSDIAEKVLKRGMLKDSTIEEIKELIKIFIDPEKSKVHGRPIYYSDLKEVDGKGSFSLQLVDMTSSVWRDLTEYHTRATTHFQVSKTGKILESEENSFSASGD